MVFSKVSCGCHSSFAITSRGNLLSWGENGSGQLGHGDRIARNLPIMIQSLPPGVTYISAKNLHVGILVASGTVGGRASNEMLSPQIDLEHPLPDVDPNIQILYDPLDRTVCDIVFVSDSQNEWRSRDGGVWPIEWLVKDLRVSLPIFFQIFLHLSSDFTFLFLRELAAFF